MEFSIRLSEKFLSFYEEIINARRFFFYIILSNYVRSVLFCRDRHRDISQTCFHVCIKTHCCKKHVCERKTLFGQPNTLTIFDDNSDITGHRIAVTSETSKEEER